jgi:phage-related protein
MITTAWETIRSRAVNTFQSMATGINDVWGSIVSTAAAARDAILGIISSIADRVTGLI